jgi:hypothetical protein
LEAEVELSNSDVRIKPVELGSDKGLELRIVEQPIGVGFFRELVEDDVDALVAAVSTRPTLKGLGLRRYCWSVLRRVGSQASGPSLSGTQSPVGSVWSTGFE